MPASALTKGGTLCGDVATGTGQATSGTSSSSGSGTSGAAGLAPSARLGLALALVSLASVFLG